MTSNLNNEKTPSPTPADDRFKWGCRLVLWLAALGLIGWLLNQSLAPLGRAEYSTNLISASTFLKFSVPSSILTFIDADGARRARLDDETVRFEFKPPVAFEKATISLRFRNKTRSNIFLQAQSRVGYSDQASLLDSEYLEQITWESIQSGAIRLWQRDPKYASIDEFFKNPPDPKRVGMIIDYPGLPIQTLVTDEQDLITWPAELNGAHVITLPSILGRLIVTFKIVELNQAAGADSVVVSVKKGSTTVKEYSIADDRNVTENGTQSTHEFKFDLKDLADGIYDVTISANNDINIKDLAVSTAQFGFKNSLRLAQSDRVGTSKTITIQSNGSWIEAQSLAAGSGLIKDSTDRYQADLTQADKPVRLTTGLGLTAWQVPSGNLQITTNGYLSPTAVFAFEMPLGQSLGNQSAINLDKFDYIVSNYQMARSDGDWKEATVSYNLRDLFTQSGRFFFSIKAPGARLNNGWIEIDKIEIKAIKAPLTTGKLWAKLKSLID